MALPFILGLAVGAGAVIAFKNRNNLKEKGSKLFEKTKENISELKENICCKKDNLEEKCEIEKKENT